MQKASQLATKVLEQKRNRKSSGTEQNQTSKALASRAVSRLFAVFGLKYGHRWISLFPDEDVQAEAEKMWGRELADISFDQIAKAVDMLIYEFPSWPPTIGEFKQLCNVGTEFNQIELEHKPRNISMEDRIRMLDQYLPKLKLALKGKL